MNFQKRFPTKGGISFVFFPNPISLPQYLLFSILKFIPEKYNGSWGYGKLMLSKYI